MNTLQQEPGQAAQNKLKYFTRKRLYIAIAIVVALTGFIVYRVYAGRTEPNKYVTTTIGRGMLIVSLTGAGQVGAEDQFDIKPKVSGKIITIPISEGQRVKKNDVLLTIDPKDALKTVRDARQSVRDASISLASARLSLDKLKQPATTADTLAAQNAVNQAERNLTVLFQGPDAFELKQAQDAVKTAQENARISSDGITPQNVRNVYDTTVATLKSTIPTIVYALTDADGMLGIDNPLVNSYLESQFSAGDSYSKSAAIMAYATAKVDAQNAATKINALQLQNDQTEKIDETITALQRAMDSMTTMLTHIINGLQHTIASTYISQTTIDGYRSSMQSSRGTMATKQAAILTQIQSINTARSTYANAGTSVAQAQHSLDKLTAAPSPADVAASQEKLREAQQKLADLKKGTEPIDIQIAQNTVDTRVASVASAQNQLLDAQQALEEYTVRAPFDGIISTLTARAADNASAGTAVATLIAKHMVAHITLNELDAAKVKIGQRATLTFDAIDELNITGSVEKVAAVGTVSQGVVTYDVTITFDTQDERIRDSMSVSASIILETKSDVVLVPNAAIKSQANQSYVEILDTGTPVTGSASLVTGTPKQQVVEVGSANDTHTEIISGLNGNEKVVTQTIQSAAATTAATSQNNIRIPGITGGGAMRGGRPD